MDVRPEPVFQGFFSRFDSAFDQKFATLFVSQNKWIKIFWLKTKLFYHLFDEKDFNLFLNKCIDK